MLTKIIDRSLGFQIFARPICFENKTFNNTKTIYKPCRYATINYTITNSSPAVQLHLVGNKVDEFGIKLIGLIHGRLIEARIYPQLKIRFDLMKSFDCVSGFIFINNFVIVRA